MENRISFNLSEEDRKQVKQAIEILEKILEPKLVNLPLEDRKELPKMGDKTVSFVEKSLELGAQYPNYMPSFIDIPEAKIDVETVRDLRQIWIPLDRIANTINDTMTLAGSEAYSSALSIYKVLKNANTMGQPGAEEAVQELRNRFPRTRKKAAVSNEKG